MNLSVLHAVKSPDRDYTMKDKLNGVTSPLGCRFLEWSGWYNQNISQRLLGHYRLYQLFKAKRQVDSQLSLPTAYVAHYSTLHIIKYTVSCITAILYYICTLGDRYHPLPIEQLNKQLIHRQFSILQEFLTYAEVDFENALHNAIDQINGYANKVPEITFIQNRLEQKLYNNTYHYLTEYNGINLSTSNELKGKQAGILSKKQILILFDLVAEKEKMGKVDFTKTNKLEAMAELFHAVNGKSKSSWEEELNNYSDKGLYHCKSEGELRELIKTLTNLSDIARESKFPVLAKTIDKKIKELEKRKA